MVIAINILTALKQARAAVRIQARVRAWLQHREFIETRTSVVIVQSLCRRLLARAEATRRRRCKAATTIQSAARGHFARSVYRATVQSLIAIQRLVRILAAWLFVFV
jgi:myosin-5